jgi:predicted nucleic acid-binding protein
VPIRKYKVYPDSCILIAWITGEERIEHEMDGVRDFFEKVERGEATLIVLRNTMFEEVQLRTPESTEKFRQLMMRNGVEIPSLDLRVERLAGELRDYYSQHGSRQLHLKDSLHLAAAIHYKVDAFYTFDEGSKGGVSLLSLNGNVAGHPLLICKPPFTQTRLF